MEQFDALLRDTLIVTAVLSLPVLAAATIAGTLVALVQAVTQIQEQTLAVLPKICIVGVLVAACGGFAMSRLAALFLACVHAVPSIVTEALP